MTITLAACGGGSTKTAATATSTTSTTVAGRAARLAAYRSCMLSHGVALPAGNGGLGFGGGRPPGTGGTTTGSAPTTTIPAGVSPQKWQAAITACASQLPARGVGGGNLQNNPQFQLYYNCLQTYLMTHGETTLPPLSQGGAGVFGGGGNGGGATGSTVTTNPSLQAARDHCAALRPSFGGGTTTTTG